MIRQQTHWQLHSDAEKLKHMILNSFYLLELFLSGPCYEYHHVVSSIMHVVIQLDWCWRSLPRSILHWSGLQVLSLLWSVEEWHQRLPDRIRAAMSSEGFQAGKEQEREKNYETLKCQVESCFLNVLLLSCIQHTAGGFKSITNKQIHASLSSLWIIFTIHV